MPEAVHWLTEKTFLPYPEISCFCLTKIKLLASERCRAVVTRIVSAWRLCFTGSRLPVDFCLKCEFYFEDKKKCDQCIYYKEVDAHGFFYKIGMFVLISMVESEMVFGKIFKIIWVNNELYFVLNVNISLKKVERKLL